MRCYLYFKKILKTIESSIELQNKRITEKKEDNMEN